MRRTMLVAAWRLGVLASTEAGAQDRPVDPGTATRSPWVIGDQSPQDGAIVEAWFDRRVPPTTNPNHVVTVGSPSDLSVWLRTDRQTCRATEFAARRTSDSTDGPLLYVCARLRNTGAFRLAAATDSPALIVSHAITVAQAALVSPAVSAAITTIVGFLIGILTSAVTDG